jgi:hypothetical protein
MNKEQAYHYLKAMPSLLKEGAKHAKAIFDEEGKGALDSAGGISGVILKLFGKPLLQKYYDKLEDKKLARIFHE